MVYRFDVLNKLRQLHVFTAAILNDDIGELFGTPLLLIQNTSASFALLISS